MSRGFLDGAVGFRESAASKDIASADDDRDLAI